MRIERQPKIILTIEEGEALEQIIDLLNRIIGNCDGAEIEELAATAARELSNFWVNDAIEIE